MLDRPRAQPAGSRRFDPKRAGWLMRAVSGRVCQVADMVILGGVFFVVVTLPAFNRHRGALLHIGISLRNVLIGAMCLGTWRMILISVGVYSPSRTQSVSHYFFRCFIGLNCCTAVVGLVEVVLRTGVDTWRVIGIYWVACLVAMAMVRGGLILFDRSRRRPLRTV